MNIMTGKPLSRRRLLRGVGSMVALPWLDAMVPASLRGQLAAKPIHRFQAIYVPNGMAMEHWSPTREGSDFELTPILEPLAPFRNQLLVFSGLEATWTRSHAGASGSFLNGTQPGGRRLADVRADISMDQLLAREFGRETQLASLEVAMDAPAWAGECSGGLNCTYTSTISWRTPTQPLPMEHNPRLVFERLFGDAGNTEWATRERRLLEQKSILDSVMEDLTGLKGEIGPQDRLRLEDFTEAVRDVERRVQLAEEQRDLELPVVEQPPGAPRDWKEHLELMFDLQLLALRTDLTRVVTFMVGKEQNARPYPEVGVSKGWHPLSHHGDDPELIAEMSKINIYHMRLFSEYLEKLRATSDGDGSLLDHMTILYGAGISNSSYHSGTNLPVIVVGGGAGRLKGGRHLTYSDQPVLANLLVTLMDKLDVPVERIGGSTGTLPIETLSGLG